MEVQVDINKDDINTMLVNAILESTLGDAMKEAVESAIKRLDSYDYKTKEILDKIVRDEIIRLVNAEYSDKIKEHVKRLATDEAISDLAEKAWEKLRRY